MRATDMLVVGEEAPDFCLPGVQLVDGREERKEICLRDFRGEKPVILTFYMAAFTPI